jgi:hypothetical protein
MWFFPRSAARLPAVFFSICIVRRESTKWAYICASWRMDTSPRFLFEQPQFTDAWHATPWHVQNKKAKRRNFKLQAGIQQVWVIADSGQNWCGKGLDFEYTVCTRFKDATHHPFRRRHFAFYGWWSQTSKMFVSCCCWSLLTKSLSRSNATDRCRNKHWRYFDCSILLWSLQIGRRKLARMLSLVKAKTGLWWRQWPLIPGTSWHPLAAGQICRPWRATASFQLENCDRGHDADWDICSVICAFL